MVALARGVVLALVASVAHSEMRDTQFEHFDYVQISGTHAASLLSGYHKALDARPHTPDERMEQVMRMEEGYESLAARATAVATVGDPLGGGEPVTEDDPEDERLDRTRLIMASSSASSSGPSALAFVSFWPDYVSIDAIAINPDFLAAGELAERAVSLLLTLCLTFCPYTSPYMYTHSSCALTHTRQSPPIASPVHGRIHL